MKKIFVLSVIAGCFLVTCHPQAKTILCPESTKDRGIYPVDPTDTANRSSHKVNLDIQKKTHWLCFGTAPEKVIVKLFTLAQIETAPIGEAPCEILAEPLKIFNFNANEPASIEITDLKTGTFVIEYYYNTRFFCDHRYEFEVITHY